MPVEVSDAEKRRLLRAWYADRDRVDALRRDCVSDRAAAQRDALRFVYSGEEPPPRVLPSYPEFPPPCVGMQCGAKAKSTGEPCKSTQVFRNGRCKFHGGLSTGPKSAEGKRASLENLRLGWEPHGLPDKT